VYQGFLALEEKMIKKTLENLKIESLNKMQVAAIEAVKKSPDVLLLSPTGSGKTLAFLLPLLADMIPGNQGVQALILVPSRELGLQIEQVFKQMNTGFKVNCFYGGHATKTERNNLTLPAALVIGTPGRIAHHLRNDNFETGTIRTLILDEFDKSLEFGFKEEMSFIISQLKKLKRRILTSATNMEEIPAFTGIKNPVKLDFLSGRSPVTAGIKVKYIQADDADKLKILFALICKLQNKPALVFCNHREAVERISLLHTGYSTEGWNRRSGSGC
jgi:superfamily II DNA/RNA helicase